MTSKSTIDPILAATAAINALQVELAAHLTPLAPDDRRRTVRPPVDYINHLRRLADELRYVPQVGQVLDQDLSVLEPSVDRIEALESAIRAVQRLLKSLEDTRIGMRADIWDMGLGAYAACQGLSKSNHAYVRVAQAMAPAFKRTRKAKPEAPAKKGEEAAKGAKGKTETGATAPEKGGADNAPADKGAETKGKTETKNEKSG